MSDPSKFLDYVDRNEQAFIGRLTQAVAIKSVSSDHDPNNRKVVQQMVDWFDGQLKQYGADTTQIDIGYETITNPDGSTSQLKLPNIIFGRIGTDLTKKTVLIYGHLDVQAAGEGWNTDPWKLDVNYETGRMTGRGSTDDKGPVCAWVNVLEAHKATGSPLPVNLRFCFEAMEESDSEGLDKLVKEEAAKGDQGWFDHVNCVCISDNYWLNTTTPIVTYGLRGIAYFEMAIGGPGSDLHSGMWGNVVHEPMTDMVNLLSRLVAVDGHILVPGAYDGIEPPDSTEVQKYESLRYTLADVQHAVGGDISLSDNVTTLLMGRMRYPSLSIHSITTTATAMTVIPATVTARFSLRIVPPQTPEEISKIVEEYVRSQFNLLGTKNKLVYFKMITQGLPWITDDGNWNFKAADEATKDVYQTYPDHCREGGSIPIALTFSDALGVSCLLLPVGRGDDGAHANNEKLDIDNYIRGTKLLGTYLYKVAAAQIPATKY